MKISKKQLRQIIREEYVRLKNHRILKEGMTEGDYNSLMAKIQNAEHLTAEERQKIQDHLYFVDSIRLAMDEMDHMLDPHSLDFKDYIKAKFPGVSDFTIEEAISSY